MATRFVTHVQTGTHAARPGAGTVPQGTLYSCSTHGVIYQSDGTSAWTEPWFTASGAGSAAYGSNANDVGTASAGGAATSNSRADHVHRGLSSVSVSSNTLYGPITLTAQGSVGLTTIAPGTIQINAVAGSGSGGGGTAGALVFLQAQTASASASLAFTSSISSTYDDYEVYGTNIIPATDAVNCILEYSTDGGSTWIASGYSWSYYYTGGSSGLVNNASDTSLHIANAVKNIKGLSFKLTMFGPGLASIATLLNLTTEQNSGDSLYYSYSGHGVDTSTAARNAFRIRFTSGNITSGTIRVYGVSKS